MKFTERTIAALKLPKDKTQLIVWDEDFAGFGAVLGKRGISFVLDYRAGQKKRRTLIGRHGEAREDGHRWTVLLARKRAKDLLGEVARGGDPASDVKARRNGPTLRDGLEAHLERMQKKRRADRSITTVRNEVLKYTATWLDRPIVEITGPMMIALHDRIKSDAKARKDTNPDNPKGGPLANRVVTHICAIWNTMNKRLHGQLGWNPTQAVDKDRLTARRSRIASEELPDWWRKVQTLSPIRRDLQTFVLFTGMRSEAARHVRWEHIDWSRAALHVPKPKGGEARQFTLPLPQVLMVRLTERQRENAELFSQRGGDQGWVFPTLSQRKPLCVIPLAEPREYYVAARAAQRAKFLPGLHTLRRTYESIAHEAGISELDLHVLTNHSFSSHNVNATYISQAFEHLAACQETISSRLRSLLHAHTMGSDCQEKIAAAIAPKAKGKT